MLSIIIQGSTLGTMARWLGLTIPARQKPLVSLELMTMAHSDYDLVVVDIPDARACESRRIRDLELPEGSVITLITRGSEVVIPKGNTCLQPGDQVTVLAHAPDATAVKHALVGCGY